MRIRIHIASFFILTLFSGGLSVFFITEKQLFLAVLSAIVTLGLLFFILNYIFKIFSEVEYFSEAARYRDFSRKYSKGKVRKKPE